MRLLLAVIKRESQVIHETPRLIALALCAPLFFGLLIVWQYAPKKLTSVPVTIVDEDRSTLSREIVRAILASDTFRLGQYANSPNEFSTLAAHNQSHICFVFPHNFEKDVQAGVTGRVAVLTDATNLLTGNIIQTKASEILGTASAVVEMRRSEGEGRTPRALAEQLALPVNYELRSWFNPAFNNNYANYLCLGVLVIPIQLSSLLIASRAGVREYRPKALHDLKTLAPTPLCLVIGKSIFYAVLAWPVYMITLSLPHFLLDVPWRGSWLLVGFIAMCFSFMLGTVAFGISALTRDPLLTSLSAAVLTLPNFLLCGYTWPNFAMPSGIHFLSYAFPMYHFVFALRRIVLMGAGWKECILEIEIGSAWTVMALVLGWVGAYLILHQKHTTGAQA